MRRGRCELRAEIHNRTPVVLKPEGWPVWLGEESADLRHLKSLLAPDPAEEMTCWPVSARVGNVKNNDPLIEPIAANEPVRWLTLVCFGTEPGPRRIQASN
jgi:putative SOS response-associated peptidase YedK